MVAGTWGSHTMKIAICGSMTFVDEMEALAAVLTAAGMTVATPVRDEGEVNWSGLDDDAAAAAKARYVADYLAVIRRCDVVLIANYEKAGVRGYVGANALVEAAFGYALGKTVAFLNPPGPQPCRLEAMAMMTMCLDGDVRRLR